MESMEKSASALEVGQAQTIMFRPVRPAAFLPDVTAIMESAQRAAAAGASGPFPQRSAFNPIPQSPVVYQPDLNQLQLLSQFGHLLPQQGGVPDLHQAFTGGVVDSQAASGSRGKGKGSSSDKASSAYASRHQAAEQRRRNRINERLDKLRSVVPHAERANTASFLEEVIKYVTALQTRVRDLEAVVGPSQVRHPPSTPDPLASMLPAGPGAQPYPAHLLSDPASLRGSLPPSLQQLPQQQRSAACPGTDSSPGFRPVPSGQKHSTSPPLHAQAPSPNVAKRSPTSSTATDDSGVPPKKRHRSQPYDQSAMPPHTLEALV